jgi:hypothetical protein
MLWEGFGRELVGGECDDACCVGAGGEGYSCDAVGWLAIVARRKYEGMTIFLDTHPPLHTKYSR